MAAVNSSSEDRFAQYYPQVVRDSLRNLPPQAVPPPAPYPYQVRAIERPPAPEPPKAVILLETPEVQFETATKPYMDRIEPKSLYISAKGKNRGELKAFRLLELPDCCAVVVASGFGFLPKAPFTDAWIKALPELVSKFGYTQVMLSTTEAASVPEPFRAISECTNWRTGNLVTVFNAPSGLNYANKYEGDDE